MTEGGVVLSFHPEASVQALGTEQVEVSRGRDSCLLQIRSAELKEALSALTNDGLAPSGHAPALKSLLDRLGDGGFLCRTVFEGSQAVVRLVPQTAKFHWTEPKLNRDHRYRLSRFAFVRRDGGEMVLETALAAARLELKSPLAMVVLHYLNEPTRLGDMIERGCSLSEPSLERVLELLLAMRALTAVCDVGSTVEDEEIPSTWEFQDLLMHAHSRQAITPFMPATPMFRYGLVEANELGRGTPPGRGLALSRPDIEELKRRDRSFTQVVESRRSTNEFSPEPMPLDTLAEFLYRVGHPMASPNPVPARAYPCGGTCYPEIYVLAHSCDRLAPGLYHYDQIEHELRAVNLNWGEVEEIYWPFTLPGGRPPIAILAAVRFPEVHFKYKGMAYALNLKNAGALLATMGLVAAAMGLAATAHGAGDGEAFSRLAGLSFYRQSSVAEFILGLPKAPTRT